MAGRRRPPAAEVIHLDVLSAWSLAIAVQATLFAVMHLTRGYVPRHFAFGCRAGFLRRTARAMWLCILMHMAGNACIVLITGGVL